MITAITYPCPIEAVGDAATEADAAGYRKYLATQLRMAFPDADVTVTDEGGNIHISTDGDYDADLESVRPAAERAWDSCPWDWVIPDAVIDYVRSEYAFETDEGDPIEDPLSMVEIRAVTADECRGDFEGRARMGDWFIFDEAQGNVVRVVDGKAVSIWNNAGMPVAQPG